MEVQAGNSREACVVTLRRARQIARSIAVGVIAAVCVPGAGASADEPGARAASIERGRYLVRIGGCNDCHTPGYPESGGDVPESQWLTGVPVGFEGPWGVSYAANLRLRLSEMTEEQWLAAARAPRLPPMPWFNLRAMSDSDLRDVYAFVRFLGPAGEQVPVAAKPGQPVSTPVIHFVAQQPAASQAGR